MATYAEKLRDPRWQKKRLEVLERDGFKCSTCQDKTKPLHVHHLRYAKSGNPWDSPDEDLLTLCCECHEEIELWRARCKEYLSRLVEPWAVEEAAGLLWWTAALFSEEETPEFDFDPSSPFAGGVCDAAHVSQTGLMRFVENNPKAKITHSGLFCVGNGASFEAAFLDKDGA